MTEQQPTTLFDRLVTRANAPVSGLAAPFDPIFESFREETSDLAAPEFGATQIHGPAAPAELRENREAPKLPRAGDPAPVERGPEPAVRQVRRVGETRIVDQLTIRRPEASPEVVMPSAPVHSNPPVRSFRRESRPQAAEPGVAFLSLPVRTQTTPSEMRPRRPHPLLMVQPDLPVTIPEPKRSGTSAAPAPEEPVIHVTIGRLEVRSAEKERPPRRPERAVTGESLEQYLAKRRKGAS